MELFELKIFSDEGIFYSDKASSLMIKGIDGYLTVLKNHSPILTIIRIGDLLIMDSKNKRISCFSSGGILFISQESTYYITNSIYLSKEVTYLRAKSIKDRIEAELQETKNKRKAKILQKDLLSATKLLDKKRK